MNPQIKIKEEIDKILDYEENFEEKSFARVTSILSDSLDYDFLIGNNLCKHCTYEQIFFNNIFDPPIFTEQSEQFIHDNKINRVMININVHGGYPIKYDYGNWLTGQNLQNYYFISSKEVGHGNPSKGMINIIDIPENMNFSYNPTISLPGSYSYGGEENTNIYDNLESWNKRNEVDIFNPDVYKDVFKNTRTEVTCRFLGSKNIKSEDANGLISGPLQRSLSGKREEINTCEKYMKYDKPLQTNVKKILNKSYYSEHYTSHGFESNIYFTYENTTFLLLCNTPIFNQKIFEENKKSIFKISFFNLFKKYKKNKKFIDDYKKISDDFDNEVNEIKISLDDNAICHDMAQDNLNVNMILKFFEKRFGFVPSNIIELISTISEEEKINVLKEYLDKICSDDFTILTQQEKDLYDEKVKNYVYLYYNKDKIIDDRNYGIREKNDYFFLNLIPDLQKSKDLMLRFFKTPKQIAAINKYFKSVTFNGITCNVEMKNIIELMSSLFNNVEVLFIDNSCNSFFEEQTVISQFIPKSFPFLDNKYSEYGSPDLSSVSRHLIMYSDANTIAYGGKKTKKRKKCKSKKCKSKKCKV